MGTGEEPPARRENGGRRRRWMGDEDDDDEEYVADEEEEEEDFAEELPASSAGEEGEDSDAEYQEDEEEEEEETPRPVKGAARGRKGKMDPATARGRKRRYEEDDDYEEEPDEDEEVEEYHEEIEEEEDDEEEASPRPKSVAKCARRGHKSELGRSNRRKFEEEDMDFEPELDDDEEEEEVNEYIDFNPGVARSNRQKFEDDMDFEPELDDNEEEVNEDIEFDPEVAQSNRRKFEENEEEEEDPPRPKSVAKCARRGHNAKLARSNQRKIDEDTDFEPDLDEEEEEADEDIDFEVDDDEDEFEDEDEEEFSARSRKVTNPVKRKSVSKRRSLKKKKTNKGSKVSKRKRKTGSAKSKKSAPVRRRKRFLVDDSDADSEDDDDFIVEDHVEENRPPRKKARTGTNKRTELDRPSVVEEETWPNLDSDTSEFEFVTSDEDRDDAGTTVVEASTVRKGKKKKRFGSESSSDSEFIVSDKELENLKETEPPKVLPVLSTPIRKISISTRHGEDKGKKKEEPEEAGIQICGICLSEEQRATVQGVLNCCSHYFCFACIMEWSRVESRCPLCKQRFTTIAKSSKADLGLGVRKAIIKVEERDQVYQPTEEEIRRWLDPYENVVCIECNQGGDDSLMLLCDICDSSAHTYCVGLGREVPEGNWYCGGCRLGDEGPSHSRIPHTAGYERQSYRNHVDFSSVGFGIAAQNGTYDRSSSINRHRSLQGIDLNLSPREAPGEVHASESQVSTDSVSTPSGTRATVSGRRQIHRYIRILLSRPRPPANRLDDMLPNFGQRNGAVPRTEPNHRSFCSSSEANTSQVRPDGFQNQYNGLPFAPSMPLDDDFQHIEGVKSNLKNMQ